MELTNALRKRIISLATAKGRRETGLFAVEGTKCVLETVGSFRLDMLLALPEWVTAHHASIPKGANVIEVRRADLREISSLTTPADVIAVYHKPEVSYRKPSASELTLALDRIQDPGNLGTIMRIASWMGITDIYCSPDTVDLYNPKVVQATMGAIARVRVHYVGLPEFLAGARKEGICVYGTFLDGNDIYSADLAPGGIIVMGNEGSGISAEVGANVDKRLLIPSYPPGTPAVESLNVSMATAFTVAEFRRRQYS